MESLRVKNLSKRFGSMWALRDATFSIRPGEILGLIGPNGSGKTTLFRCLAGVSPPTSGSIFVDNRELGARERKHTLYFVPDGVSPWPDQTARWTLNFVAGLHGSRVVPSEIIDALGMASFADARLGELSKGQHRRVMLAVGLLSPRQLLMLDEPFDGLDLRQTRDVMRVLRTRVSVRGGQTLFLSIHQLGDAARICDRLVLLSGGRVVGEGNLDELRRQAGVVDSSGGLEEVFLALT